MLHIDVFPVKPVAQRHATDSTVLALASLGGHGTNGNDTICVVSHKEAKTSTLLSVALHVTVIDSFY